MPNRPITQLQNSYDFRLQHRRETRRHHLPRAKRSARERKTAPDPGLRARKMRRQEGDLLRHLGCRKPVSAIPKKSSNSATSIAWCWKPSGKGSWRASSTTPKPKPWPPSSNSTCNGKTLPRFTTNRNLTMQLRVTEDGTAVPSARLTFRFARPDAAPFYTQAVTDSAGSAADLHRGRGIRLARLLRHGASQPRRPHRDPQIRPAQSRVTSRPR